MENAITFLGLFATRCPVFENDTCSMIARRLARLERNVKDAKKVALLRYEDAVLGPRKMPSLEKIDDGKIEIGSQHLIFKIDLESKEVKLHNTNTSHAIQIGDTVVYRV